jgi:hypothetical protein
MQTAATLVNMLAGRSAPALTTGAAGKLYAAVDRHRRRLTT